MARNNKPIIIGAAVLGALALLATLFTLFSGPPAPNAAANTAGQPVAEKPQRTQFVAVRDIPPRTRLTRDLFQERVVDEDEVPPGAITDLTDLGARLSNRPIPRGAVITREATIEAVRRVIDADIPIPAGLRAVAIYVNPDQTAAGLVDVGDRVDVIATHRFPVAVGANQRVSGAAQVTAGRVVAQNLEVLAVDQSISAPPPTPTPPPAGAPGAPPAGAPGAPAAPVAPTPAPPPGQDRRTRVLLAAPIDVAARLVAAGEEGKLHIAIRNPSSADQFPVPEAREYPSRIVQVPVARTGGAAAASGGGSANAGNSGGGGGTSSRRSRDDSDSLAPPVPSIPAPSIEVPPAPVPVPAGRGNGGSGGSGLPAPGGGAPIIAPAPSENEVTVIRGTEKTRVLVPR